MLGEGHGYAGEDKKGLAVLLDSSVLDCSVPVLVYTTAKRTMVTSITIMSSPLRVAC